MSSCFVAFVLFLDVCFGGVLRGNFLPFVLCLSLSVWILVCLLDDVFEGNPFLSIRLELLKVNVMLFKYIKEILRL